jgi:hypothetical protein
MTWLFLLGAALFTEGVPPNLVAYTRTVLKVRDEQPAHGFFLPCPQNGNPFVS